MTKTPFDFGLAVTQLFQTSGGMDFAKRLWFWTTLPMAVSMLIALPLLLPHYGELLVWSSETLSPGMDQEDIGVAGLWAILSNMIPGLLVWTLGCWTGQIMGEAALHRKVLLNHEAPHRPIRIGGDERRVFVAQLGVGLIVSTIYFVGILATVVLAAALGHLGGILAFIGILLMIFFLFNTAIRLMPAAGLSVQTGQLRVWSARAVSKGKFWQLFGAFIVVYIANYIVVSLVNMIGMTLVFGDFDMSMAILSGSSENMRAIVDAAALRLKNPVIIFAGVLSIIAWAAALAMMYLTLSGVGSYAVKWWEDDNDTSAEQEFS